MRTLVLTLIVIGQLMAAQKDGCTNPSIQWTINPLYIDGNTPSAIQGDGSPYVDGQSGVSAVIYVCSGTYDAVLSVSRPRSLSVNFGKLLASNSNTPSWALSGSTESGSSGNFDVRNIWFVPTGSTRNQEYTFTTRLGSTVPASGSPNFTMTNPSPQAPSSVPNLLPIANNPYNDALVVVHHCPANSNTASCPNITHETWFAYADQASFGASSQTGLPIAQVGTLLVTSHGSQVNAGQFSMPFFFTISLLN